MEATKKTIDELKQIGFTEISPKKLIFKDITAYLPLDGSYVFFKYSGKELPIMNSVENIKLIIKGLYN